MARYSNHQFALASAEHIIRAKIASQCCLSKKKFPTYTSPKDNRTLLLIEGRVASQYWKHYRILVPVWTNFHTRKPHADPADIVNQLLDIGYHYLKEKVAHVLKIHDISPAIGLLHVAKTNTSTPLVYDLMELFRVDLVDLEVLHYLKLKKKPLLVLQQKDITQFLSRIKHRLKKRVYLKNFAQCHTYEYAMEIQILHFIHAVNHGEIYRPIHIPTRHDSRCKQKSLTPLKNNVL
jgi:CRISPR-associated endonuclease Cas1